MLWMDKGLGKTITSLTAVTELQDRAAIRSALVLAPVRVLQSVWEDEAQKWEHTRHLTFARAYGPDANRRTREALRHVDVHLVNYENLEWLADVWTKFYLSRGRYPPVDLVIYDEVSRMKSATSKRHKAMQRLLPFVRRRVGLTGTPAANGLADLFGQYLAVDGGERLGTSKSHFMSRFFRPDNPFSPWAKQVPNPDASTVVQGLVGDITVQMSNADYIELPPVLPNVIALKLPSARRAQYEKLEREMFVELDSGHEVESFNAAALTNRCLQYAQGAMYHAPGEPAYEEIHGEKLDALDSIVEEAAGKPVLIAIAFRHDGYRILDRYPAFRWVDSKVSSREFNRILDDWESGQLPGLIAHPKSVAHGIDRLKNGPVDDLVWFGHTWSLEDYEQTIARLQRQGRTRPIRMHHLVMTGTVEEAQRLALDHKARTQNDLKAALNEYRQHKQQS